MNCAGESIIIPENNHDSKIFIAIKNREMIKKLSNTKEIVACSDEKLFMMTGNHWTASRHEVKQLVSY